MRARSGSAPLGGNRLRTLREAANLTQKELADALSVSVRSVQAWEAGTSVPQARHRRSLAEFFSVPEAEGLDPSSSKARGGRPRAGIGAKRGGRMKQLSLRKGFAFAAALLLVGAAIAVAVATHGSGSTTARTDLTRLAKGGDPDAAAATAKDTPGEGPDVGRPAAEEWAHKAYPANDIPFGAQVDALRSLPAPRRHVPGVAADPGPERCRGQSVDVGRSVEGGIPGRPDVLRRRLHRRRADHGARHPPALLRGRLHAVRRRSRRRHLAHDQRPRGSRARRTGSSSPARSDRTRSAS